MTNSISSDAPQYVDIIKTTVGSITFDIVNPDTGMKQVIDIPADAKKRMVPIKVAALVYVDTYSGAYKMYKQGYFTFSNVEAVYNYAYKNNLIMGDVDIKNQPVSLDYMPKIYKALISDDTTYIDAILEKSDKGKMDVLSTAGAHIKELKTSMVNHLEQKTGTSLSVKEE